MKPTAAQRRVLEILRDGKFGLSREQIRQRLYYGATGSGHVVAMLRRLLRLELVWTYLDLYKLTVSGQAALAEGSEQLPVKKRRGK